MLLTHFMDLHLQESMEHIVASGLFEVFVDKNINIEYRRPYPVNDPKHDLLFVWRQQCLVTSV